MPPTGSLSRNRSASSGDGTAMSWPRCRSRNSMRELAASRSASSAVSAQIDQTATITFGSAIDRRGFGRKALAVVVRQSRALRIDEVGDAIGQTEFGRPGGAVGRGAEQPGLRRLRAARQRLAEMGEGMAFRHRIIEIGEQLRQLLRESHPVPAPAGHAAAHRPCARQSPVRAPGPRSTRPGNRPLNMLRSQPL